MSREKNKRLKGLRLLYIYLYMLTFYSSCTTNVSSILQQWYLGIMYEQRFETNIMLFNTKLCRWRSVANLNSVLSHSWAPRTDAEWRRRCVYTHRKQCVRILKTWRDATRRCASCPVCDRLKAQ